MKAARLQASKRLKRLARVLAAATLPLSTMDLIRQAGIAAVSASVAELRAPINGWVITCKSRQTRAGRVFEYQATGIPREALKLLR